MRRFALAWLAAATSVVLATSASAATPSRTTPSPSGVGSALGSTGGIIVLAVLALGFLWVRARSLRR